MTKNKLDFLGVIMIILLTGVLWRPFRNMMYSHFSSSYLVVLILWIVIMAIVGTLYYKFTKRLFQ
ncbi:hypothetical protein [Companilactobacillus mishanensis]|uniref:Uncharacterized protein n=1 Tax=Companilactobacillus mishanensis TaxID=2486008 RepID=A0ABW9P9N7_9LACO|nr:hypothetical protein [Companilactobacillus mishanensis]MQS45837.1 hypothetical protein [Companilactobacillus mishanensis]